jgi:hypothetical protein
MKLRKWGLSSIFAAGLTALALWLSFRRAEGNALLESFARADYLWVAAATGLTVLTLYGLGWRWQILLRPKEKIPLSRLFRLNVISQYVNILMPARLGEVVRVYLTSRESRVTGGYALGTVAIERVFDFLVFVALWAGAPAFFALGGRLKALGAAVAACAGATCLLGLLAWKPDIFLRAADFLARLLPGRAKERAAGFLRNAVEAFESLRSVKILAALIGLTFALIFGQVLTNFLLFKAMGVRLGLWPSLFVLLAVQVGNIPPSLPGKIGVFEYAVILALSAFGVTGSAALAYALMLHVVAYVPKIVLGAVFISRTPVGRPG